MNSSLQWRITSFFFLAILSFIHESSAAFLYEKNFDDLAPGDPVNLGTSSLNAPNYKRTLTPNGGVGGSPALMFSLDRSQRADVSVGVYPFPINNPIEGSDAAPIGNLNSLVPSQIRFSVDIKSTGNISPTPITLRVFQLDASYEADRGIDVNGDGDSTDSAYIFQSSFQPTIVDGGGFATAAFTLDQGILTASIAPGPSMPSVPLTPAMDPTVPLAWSFSFGADGYGNDDGNVIIFDNIRVELIPEPSSCCIAYTLFAAAVAFRRKILNSMVRTELITPPSSPATPRRQSWRLSPSGA